MTHFFAVFILALPVVTFASVKLPIDFGSRIIKPAVLKVAVQA